jgi:hypothetical protein
MYWEVNAQRKPRVYVLRLVYAVERNFNEWLEHPVFLMGRFCDERGPLIPANLLATSKTIGHLPWKPSFHPGADTEPCSCAKKSPIQTESRAPIEAIALTTSLTFTPERTDPASDLCGR